MLCVTEIESNCGVSEPFQLGSEDHMKGAIPVPVLSSRSQRKLGLSSRPERRCACGLIKPRRQTIRKRCRQTDAPTRQTLSHDQTNTTWAQRRRSHGCAGLTSPKSGLQIGLLHNGRQDLLHDGPCLHFGLQSYRGMGRTGRWQAAAMRRAYVNIRN